MFTPMGILNVQWCNINSMIMIYNHRIMNIIVHQNSISTIQNINNGELKAIKAMPQKDISSDGNSSFEMGRQVYMRTYPTNPNLNKSTVTRYNWHAHQNVQQITTSNGKKWYGNRDASQITEKKRNNSIGIGSLNASGKPLGFTTHTSINTVNDALTRVRAGGATAPPKKDANRHNNLTPSFAPVNHSATKIIYGNKTPYLYH
jgi:hypothetical protein